MFHCRCRGSMPGVHSALFTALVLLAAPAIRAAEPDASAAASPAATDAAGGSASGQASPGTQLSTIVVTAQRLNVARAEIETQTGASTYTITSDAIAATPGGQNVQLNQVLLQAPDVVQDSFGQLHVRADHNDLQYRLNGIILPEGISVFSQTLSPRLISSLSLITGALPAEYGLRTAGIIDLTTNSGLLQPGGYAPLYGGSFGTFQPAAEYAGSSGISGDLLYNGIAQYAFKDDTALAWQTDVAYYASPWRTHVRTGLYLSARSLPKSVTTSRGAGTWMPRACRPATCRSPFPTTARRPSRSRAFTCRMSGKPHGAAHHQLRPSFTTTTAPIPAAASSSPRINFVWQPVPGTIVRGGYSR